MIFEGSEKKVEVIVKGLNLRELGREFWADVVDKAQATILSDISNEKVDAYLLSESSLFVWDHHLLMLTCGTTTLANAVEAIVNKVGADEISALIYQRKNEHFGHLQNSTFYDDKERIEKLIDAKSLRFGPKHEHHNFLLHSNRPYTPIADDFTSELLMYDIQSQASTFLTEPGHSSEAIRDFFELERLLPGFQIDDFAFDPYGYSMNAIKDQFYCTIHVTPQEESSYVSFETNLPLGLDTQNIFKGLIEKLAPQSFDTVAFNCDMQQFMPELYNRKTVVRETLDIGYEVIFCHYYLEVEQEQKAAQI